jgi:DNA-binding CsgD family transcriptional regulator
MSHLSNKDLLRVLEAVTVLNSGTGMATLPDRTLNCVLMLIPTSTMTAFDGFDSEGDYNGSLWYSPPASVPEQSVKLFGDLVHEHPYFQKVISTADENIFRTSDHIALSEFHKTSLFNEFYRLFKGESQMTSGFRLSPTSLVTCSIHRPNTDFVDSELEMLRLITPHLRAAFRNARDFENVSNERKYLSATVTRGLIVLGSSGETVFINDIAERLFQDWFVDFLPGQLPDAVGRFVLAEGEKFYSGEYNRPPVPFVIRRGNSELTIHLAFDTQPNETTLFIDERKESSTEDFRHLGLSERESEILYWMSKGKADREIALLCGISYRTVEKHAENVYIKLGVENRLAAVMAAVDKLPK